MPFVEIVAPLVEASVVDTLVDKAAQAVAAALGLDPRDVLVQIVLTHPSPGTSAVAHVVGRRRDPVAMREAAVALAVALTTVLHLQPSNVLAEWRAWDASATATGEGPVASDEE